MPSFESFSASVVVDGQPLNEYSVETSSKDGCTMITCWIASEAGKQYKVRWKEIAREIACEGVIYVDGTNCGSKVLFSRQDNRVVAMKGIRTSPTSLQPFEFSYLHLTDNEDVGEMPINVGQIELHVYRWQEIHATKKKPSRGTSLPADQVYNEKTKKGIDHRTRFGEAVRTQITNVAGGKRIGKAFLRFRVLYRPLAVLQAHGIAPPPQTDSSSSHSSRTGKHPREGSTEDVKPAIRDIVEPESDEEKEMERLQARLNELKAKHGDRADRKKVKREPDEHTVAKSGDRVDRKKAKREPDEHTVKREDGSSRGPWFIDLT